MATQTQIHAHPVRVLFAAAEAFPLAKTGGLADVVGALPVALSKLGTDVRIMLPGYEHALDLARGLSVVAGGDLPDERLLSGWMPDTGLPVLLFDAPDFFKRGGHPYMDEQGHPWPDNDRRYAAFCRAAAQVALGRTGLGWRPEIVHAHDWQTGLLPAYMHFSAEAHPRTVFTIHNLAFQGNFPMSSFPALGLPAEAATQDGIEFHDQLSFLKAGILYSDRVTTVSPNYAREIMTPEFGCGLDGLLRARRADFSGILNGIDDRIWDPANDPHLAQRFSAGDPTGKRACKQALLRQMNLPPDMDVPVIASVNRLTHQKMADVLLDVLPHLVDHGAMFVVIHGQGDRSYETDFLTAARHHAGNVSVRIGYDEGLAHQVFAGADMFLSLARFEPCGLTAMYAMRYGAIPIASPVGGMVDSVEDAGELETEPGCGTGFLCDGNDVEALDRAVARAVSWYRAGDAWTRLRHRAMSKDLCWDGSAHSYSRLYGDLVGRRAEMMSATLRPTATIWGVKSELAFDNQAPGWPGSAARWTSSAKNGIGTALQHRSNVWFTLSHGILNEIYYPRIDQACTRDFGLIVTDGKGYFSEEKRNTDSTIRPVAEGVPSFEITNECRRGCYRIEKCVFADPQRDVVLQRVKFRPTAQGADDFRLFTLLAPHLVNRGAGNTAWVDDYKGVPMLFAEGSGTFLALGCSAPFLARSAGFVGVSDGWQDLTQHFQLQWHYDIARDGNVALTGEIDLKACDGDFVLALGFGRTAAEAALKVRASLQQNMDIALADYVAGWRDWQDGLLTLGRERGRASHYDTYRVSTAVLRSHQASSQVGGYIASLSIPWGYAKGDDDLGGYHLAWPRDLVETAGGLLAAGAKLETRQVIGYLQGTQEADGHWSQNFWLDGTPYWSGVQLDETALPILLVDLALREGALDVSDLPGLWPMIEKAARYIVVNGPVTPQDRWEENGGYTAFTLAAEIAALLAAADLADRFGTPARAAFLRETADIWNNLIEHWIYVTDTPLSRQVGVDGYYVRVAPPGTATAASPKDGFVPIKNRPPEDSVERAAQIVSPDALALVRFGLRAADDPRILNTVKVIDALLKTDLPAGPGWHRYNDDGYGEHDDGRPFDGTGIGRCWPLLTGERAHYELALGNKTIARSLLKALEGFASDGHLIPEQVWDRQDIPERELFLGRPSGSAMPLAWAHAEHVKLLRSLSDNSVFDAPTQARQRYQVQGVRPKCAIWRFNNKCSGLGPGNDLRIELPASALVHWSVDGWHTVHDTPTTDSGFGLHYADIKTQELEPGARIVFTFHWSEADRWEGKDYEITIRSGAVNLGNV